MKKSLILALSIFTLVLTLCSPNLPVVITSKPTNIRGTSATLNGEITAGEDIFITERGFVYSTTTTTPIIGARGAEKIIVDLNSNKGKYTKTITDLSLDTKYIVRFYVKNADGTFYGTAKMFTTLPQSPPYSSSCSGYYETDAYEGQGVNIDGLWWAPVNVGYTVDNPYGLLFNWGKNRGFEYDGTGYSLVDGHWSELDQGPCPDGWRIPTVVEYENLLAVSPVSTVRSDGMDEIYHKFPGRMQEARVNNPNSDAGHWFGPDCKVATVTTSAKSVYFIAAGYWWHTYSQFNSRGSVGSYWASASGRRLRFFSGHVYMFEESSHDVSDGLSVRCVQDSEKTVPKDLSSLVVAEEALESEIEIAK